MPEDSAERGVARMGGGKGALDLSKVRVIPIDERPFRVYVEDLVFPDIARAGHKRDALGAVVERVVEATELKRQVVAFIGGAFVKRGCGPLLTDLVKRGVVTHVAMNGAASIHDFELAYVGKTSEPVQEQLDKGMFGMAAETAEFINEAVAVSGAAEPKLGYGRAVGEMILDKTMGCRHTGVSIQAACARADIPCTVHVTIGADVTHMHASADFAAMGAASGRDFLTFVETVASLEGGVLLNLCTAVTGPEVFLKALSLARNLGRKVEEFTAAVFDVQDPARLVHPETCRFLKNVVGRPVVKGGGEGHVVVGDIRETFAELYARIVSEMGEGA